MEVSRTRSVVLTILIIAGILGIAGLILWYISSQNAANQQTGQIQNKTYCGQYFVGQAASCTPDNALYYNIAETTTGTCQVTSAVTKSGMKCDIFAKKSDGSCTKCSDGSDATISGTNCSCCTLSELNSCTAVNFTAQPIVKDINLTDSSDRLIIPPLNSQSSVKISARFGTPNDTTITYSQFTISVNGQDYNFEGACTTDCVKESGDFVVTKTLNLTELGNISTLSVTASAKTSSPYTTDPTPASRVYSVRQLSDAYCGTIVTNTSDTTKPPVSFIALEIPVNNLGAKADVTKLAVTFTFTGVNGYTKLTTKSVINQYNDTTGKIVLNQEFLSTASNFVEGKAFPRPTFAADSTLAAMDIKIFANTEYTTKNVSVAKTLNCGADDLRITRVVPTDNGNTDAGTTTPAVTSNFAILKRGPACFQRVSPSNQGTFTITITNADSDSEQFRNVKDKLPRGFTYVANSTKINGTAVSDSGLITLNTVTNSQQVTWSRTDNWTLAANAVMTISFRAIANSQAITGTNVNEVVLEPTNTPQDPTSIRHAYSFNVAQNCGAPRTGLFDSTASKIALGVIALLLGIALLTTQYGAKLSSKIAFTGPIQSIRNSAGKMKSTVSDKAEDLKLSIFDRRKFFEKKATRKEKK